MIASPIAASRHSMAAQSRPTRRPSLATRPAATPMSRSTCSVRCWSTDSVAGSCFATAPATAITTSSTRTSSREPSMRRGRPSASVPTTTRPTGKISSIKPMSSFRSGQEVSITRCLPGSNWDDRETANFRNTGYFTTIGVNTTIGVRPRCLPRRFPCRLSFRQGATDADNDGVATVAALYAQDQVAMTSKVHAVIGLRYDSFQVDFRNNRTASDFSSRDGLLSPRVGVIYKPIVPVSIYGSYSLSYLPRAGEQLSSLSLTNQALDPEEFRNYEVGAKWDVLPVLSLTTAIYQLDRGNVAVPDPADPTRSILVDAQRTRGLEVGLSGNVTRQWSLIGGYALQDGEITQSISATAVEGAVLAQLPRHSFSLWNKYEPDAAMGRWPRLRSIAVTCSPPPTISSTLPGYTRVDGGLFMNVTPQGAGTTQRRESVRRGVPPLRTQQHQHHARFAACAAADAEHAILRAVWTMLPTRTLASPATPFRQPASQQPTSGAGCARALGLRFRTGQGPRGRVAGDPPRRSGLRSGASGSGKSTFLRLVAGVARPTYRARATRRCRGRRTANVCGARDTGKWGWCFRTTRCSPISRWRRTSPLAYEGGRGPEIAIRSFSSLLGTRRSHAICARATRTCSPGGERQRVALARALRRTRNAPDGRAVLEPRRSAS